MPTGPRAQAVAVGDQGHGDAVPELEHRHDVEEGRPPRAGREGPAAGKGGYGGGCPSEDRWYTRLSPSNTPGVVARGGGACVPSLLPPPLGSLWIHQKGANVRGTVHLWKKNAGVRMRPLSPSQGIGESGGNVTPVGGVGCEFSPEVQPNPRTSGGGTGVAVTRCHWWVTNGSKRGKEQRRQRSSGGPQTARGTKLLNHFVAKLLSC